MPEISLADLLAWEPRLHLATTGAPGAEVTLEQEVTWAVTLRATPPLLPQLRGGEIVLLPPRLLAEATTESGITLSGLLHELAGHRITAVVLEEVPPAAPVPSLITAPLTPELESEINRLLTQRRGEMYRVGTELGRILANLTANQATPEQILAAAGEVTGYPMAVRDERGYLIAAVPAAPSADNQSVGVRRQLTGGATLHVHEVPPTGLALARVLADRTATALETALARAERTRPHGTAREAALHRLLVAPEASRELAPAALGLPPRGPLRVVLAGPGLSDARLHRLRAPLGTAHAAGEIDGLRAAILEDHSGQAMANGPLPPVAPGCRAGPPTATTEWLAVSAPVTQLAELPAATREARYVAALLTHDLAPGPIARFDAIADIGVFRLLYSLWGSSALAEFVHAVLGELPAQDRRGILRRTWLAFLAAGGSHVEAAAALGVHRNTLTYRLKHIAEITDHDPEDPATWPVTHVALLAEKLPPPPPDAYPDHPHT